MERNREIIGGNMITNKIEVNNDGTNFEEVVKEVTKYAQYAELSKDNAFQVQLLTEELLGMFRGLVGEYTGTFWVDGDSKEAKIYLIGSTDMTTQKRKDLLAFNKKGNNAAAKGIFGKIRNAIEVGFLNYEEVEQQNIKMGVNPMMPYDTTWVSVWSLQQYKELVKNDENKEEWDELEKSIVVKYASDISVGIKAGEVEILVTKKFQ